LNGLIPFDLERRGSIHDSREGVNSKVRQAHSPISFLSVPPNSRFVFHVQCNLDHLNRIAPELAMEERCKKLLSQTFEHAFDWLGFGAKTAVGSGAIQSEVQRQSREAGGGWVS
jgi:CRISPR/Cas system CMR subunit Cmr6 (Cas7 group RAMP superfamily)